VPAQTVNAIAIDPATPQNVYLASPDGLFRSADGGLNWEALPSRLSSEPVALTLDPQHPATLFVLLADGSLLRSDDGGTAWITVEVGS
jgi:photosystem II stability/assembly factor-like uncharacterized protein